MALAAPTGLAAEFIARPNSEDAIKLTWNAVVGAVSYKVHKNDDRHLYDESLSTEEVFDASSNEYFDSDLAGGMDIFYYVTAVDATGDEGTPSDTLTNIHPYLERVIEKVEVEIGDDFAEDIMTLKPFHKKIAIDMALSYINSVPAATNFVYSNYPRRWEHLLIYGGCFHGLMRLVILEKAKEMDVNDQGTSWSPPKMSETLRQMAKEWQDIFEAQVKVVKKNYRPSPLGIGSMKAIYGSPVLNRFRHLRAHRVI